MQSISYIFDLFFKTSRWWKLAIIGAGIGYVFITIFLLNPGLEVDPSWPRLWKVRPLIIVPLISACCGMFVHFMTIIRSMNIMPTPLLYFLTFLLTFIGFWIGVVLGLDGTLWN
jgi:hypothetical protein